MTIRVMDPPAPLPDAELAGQDGLLQILPFKDSQQEAEARADRIRGWIIDEGLAASEIAVLVSRQPELYGAPLMAALQDRAVPFRNEATQQDLSVEPVARLIIDFLTVIVGEREPDAYERLMDVLMGAQLSDDAAYETRARWRRFADAERAGVQELNTDAIDADVLCNAATRFLDLLGRERLTALSADYEQGNRLDELISQTCERTRELLDSYSPVEALAKFYEDSAVRIMTIHKSKGLEFDTVVMLGIENETFWGKIEEERSAFFVGISRAKQRLCLTRVQRHERPDGFSRRWDAKRTSQREFLGYAAAAMKS